MTSLLRPPGLLAVFFFVAGVGRAQVNYDLTLHVVDERGLPVAGAKVEVSFTALQDKDFKGKTDKNGKFHADQDNAIHVGMQVEKEGYYPISFDSEHDTLPQGKAQLELVLPRILSPIPLYNRRVNLKFPARDTPLGFDLKENDWVPPYGKGRVTDILFTYHADFRGFKGTPERVAEQRRDVQGRQARLNKPFTEEAFMVEVGKWDVTLDLTFPHSGEGLVEDRAHYWTYGTLRLPHTAPETGYVETLHLTACNYRYDQHAEQPHGAYLRTRVQRDDSGRIVSANYTKLYDRYSLSTWGFVTLWYFFNPTPNDRNLEFDTTRNLFKLTEHEQFTPFP